VLDFCPYPLTIPGWQTIRDSGGGRLLKTLWQDFRYSLLVTFFCLAVAAWWGAAHGGMLQAIWIALVLGFMEVTLSFDNAVVNASVLREMDQKWRTLFLTVGILVAVFGMRLVFPVLIVSVATGEGMWAVGEMALARPDEYAHALHAHHVGIASFGGIFLLLVCLSFLLDPDREHHWLGSFEQRLGHLGDINAASVIVAAGTLLSLQWLLPVSDEERLTMMVAGISGLVLFAMVDSIDYFFDTEDTQALQDTAKRSGLAGFVYLEILDASFSFDGVIGAFAITRDVVIIMLGLAIGAMFVRSLTVYLVNRGTLDAYVYLEHGAHYAIGALGLIMLASITIEVPEAITGLIGVAFIAASVWSSIQHPPAAAEGDGDHG
jgi:hypothetical protein